MATGKNGKKPSGLKNDGVPNAYWRKFKARLDTYDQVPVQDWKADQFLGHILKRYKDCMGVEFALSYSGPPTKCKEIYCVRRMLLALGTEDGSVVKKYIDWVFDTNILPQKVTISSIAYFFTTTFILKFKQEFRRQNHITRATNLPNDIQHIVTGLELDVKTYGDLAMAKLAVENDPRDPDLSIYYTLFDLLQNAGFDEAVLGNLE